ncbi:Degradation enzyme regulation protein DegQ [Bacillus lacus]|uniref:Degradation enzyme regulation protein DegQ n=1 Tax=Metabacillus lacus TaxID=1983721 RepID=A0A7X2M0S5_9BACI|nr:degradation enzyme regulation protein DegQ [Metabacillus lacus]MRX73567.1 Degradation enzyme regulation protein DegQ [Metabacillus lacus]
MNKHTIEEMALLLERLEEEIQETKKSLHSINNSIDKYDKYTYLKVS